ncbi:GntR family transcriptional regulator [Streptomyces bungoensis]|uniref:GntR family transcriptional regulator n=1 Tax=Streptomyces bungoensis TaxID=285568 RepID=UPI0036B0C5CD
MNRIAAPMSRPASLNSGRSAAGLSSTARVATGINSPNDSTTRASTALVSSPLKGASSISLASACQTAAVSSAIRSQAFSSAPPGSGAAKADLPVALSVPRCLSSPMSQCLSRWLLPPAGRLRCGGLYVSEVMRLRGIAVASQRDYAHAGDMPSLDRSRNLWPQIADDLRRRLRAGEWKPGERFPGTVALAAEYGTAQATTQKALVALRAEGWLRLEVGRGSYVADPLP